jgi:flavin-dependent dehydrogenase
VGGPLSLAKYVNGYYERLLRELGINVKETISLQGHTIPFRANNNKIYSNSALLLGDAAGLTDPLTGEGIYYALKSGIIASSVITDFLNNNINDLSVYQQRVDEEIMPELYAALPIQYIFNIAPLYFHKYLRDSDRLWNAFCRILRGELSYTIVKSKLPASDIYWKSLISTASFINKIKTKQLLHYK